MVGESNSIAQNLVRLSHFGKAIKFAVSNEREALNGSRGEENECEKCNRKFQNLKLICNCPCKIGEVFLLDNNVDGASRTTLTSGNKV